MILWNEMSTGRERPGQPGETAVFCCGCNPFAFPFCRESGEGLPSGKAAQKEGRGGKRRGSGFAYPEERRCAVCPRSQHAPPPLPLATPVPLQKNKPKINPNKINSLLLHQNTFRKQQRERGWGENQCYFILRVVY